MKKILLHNKGLGMLLIFLFIVSNVLGIIYTFALQQLLNKASVGDTDNIWNLIIFGAFLCLVWAIMFFCANYLRDTYKNECFFLLRKTYITNLLSSKYSDITNLDSATHISALTNNIEILNQNYFLPILSIFDYIFVIVLSFVAVLIISPLITVLMCGLTLLMAVIPALLKKTMDNANFSYSLALQNFTAKLKETLLGIEVIKTNNAEKSFETQNEKNSQNILKKQNKVAVISDSIGSSSTLVNNALIIVLVGVASLFTSDGKLEIGSTIAVMNLAMRFLGGWMSLVNQIVLASSTRSLRNEIEPYLKNISEEKPSVIKEFKEGIRLSNVSFQYKSNTKKTVLNNIDLNFKPKKKYLILGKSGSGKSTLLKLISKLEDEYTGSIELDGTDYDKISPNNVGEIISLAQQKCYLFKTTLKDNIDLNGTNDKKRLDYAIEAAQLTDFVSQQPNGLETVVDEEVNQVSGGEKLRINLARALYKDTPILLLDEITSAVDKITAQKIEDAILQIKNKTVINVCHKFEEATLRMYDEIIILENGKIVAQGSYNNLKDNPILLSYQGKKIKPADN